MFSKLRKKSGFTLIEALITCVIISGGLFGLMVLYSNAARSVMQGDMDLMATYLAREKLEQLISDKYHYGYDHVINDNYTTSESVSVGDHFFTRSLNIYEVDRDDLSTVLEDSGYKRIDMTVSWGLSAKESITTPTLLTDY